MALDTNTLPALNPPNAQVAQTAADRAALARSFSLQNPLLAAGMDIATLPGRAAMGVANTALRLPRALGADIPFIPEAAFGGDSSSMTPYFDRLRTQETPAEVAPAAPVAAPVAPVKPETPAVGVSATPKPQSNWDIANAFATKQAAAAGGAPEIYRTSLALALKGLNAETAAQAQATSAGKERGGALAGLQDLGVETQYNEMGLPVQTTKRVATIDPGTGMLKEIKLPTIAAKAPLPPKADLKAGQAYPGYGTWTGTGFRPQ
jgi:hypothetical protein